MEPSTASPRPSLMHVVVMVCLLGFTLLLSSCSVGDPAQPGEGGAEPGGTGTKPAANSCALVVTLDGKPYVAARNDVDGGVRGKRLGEGAMKACAGVGGPTTQVAIYAVEGSDPTDKVIAAGWGTLVPYRDDLRDEDTP